MARNWYNTESPQQVISLVLELKMAWVVGTKDFIGDHGIIKSMNER